MATTKSSKEDYFTTHPLVVCPFCGEGKRVDLEMAWAIQTKVELGGVLVCRDCALNTVLDSADGILVIMPRS